MTEFTFRHNVDRERFEVLADGHVIGKAAYKAYDDGGTPQRIFYHTVINEEFGGQGLAGGWLKHAAALTGGEVKVMQRRRGTQGFSEGLNLGDFVLEFGLACDPFAGSIPLSRGEIVQGVTSEERIVRFRSVHEWCE